MKIIHQRITIGPKTDYIEMVQLVLRRCVVMVLEMTVEGYYCDVVEFVK